MKREEGKWKRGNGRGEMEEEKWKDEGGNGRVRDGRGGGNEEGEMKKEK